MKKSIFPSFSKAEYARRYGNIRALMEAHGVAALVIYGESQLNRGRQADLHYVTNFLGAWGNYCVFPRSGEPALFVQSFNHVPDAQRASIVEDTRHGVAALVIYGESQLNRGRQADLHYVTNFLGAWGNYCVFPRSGEPALFVQSFNHVPDAQRASIVEDTRHGGANSGETVARHLREIGITRGEVGLVGGLPYDHYLIMTERLPEVKFKNLTGPYRHLRSDKSEEEVAWMRRGAAFTDAAMYALKEQVRPGLAEYQLAAVVEESYLRDGGQTGLHYISSTSMHNSDRCAPAQNHGDRVIQKGDVILTEITATYWGYGGQILRPIAVQEDPTPDYQELYDVAEEAYYRVTGAIKPGATVAEVHQVGAFIDETEFTICDGLVHGFGISLVPPSFYTPATEISPLKGDFVFKRNMCVVVQPNIITKDYQKGVQLGNVGVVTEQGFESLQKYPVEFVRAG